MEKQGGYYKKGEPVKAGYIPQQQHRGFSYPVNQPPQPASAHFNNQQQQQRGLSNAAYHASPSDVRVITQQPVMVAAVGSGAGNFDDHLVASVMACLLCCWPLGLLAIMKSKQARSAYGSGDLVLANERARQARNLAIASCVAGAMIVVIIISMRIALSR